MQNKDKEYSGPAQKEISIPLKAEMEYTFLNSSASVKTSTLAPLSVCLI